MDTITTSLFELFKIGPGPSSSHTIGPMRMGNDFVEAAATLPPGALARATGLRVTLHGSLSATGRGHGTHCAIVAGLLGHLPEACPPGLLASLDNPDTLHTVRVGNAALPLRLADIVFGPVVHDHPYNNTLSAELMAHDEVLFRREYYSVGGGFITWKGRIEPLPGRPAHPYANAADVRRIVHDKRISLSRLMLDNEMAITGTTETAIMDGLDRILDVMDQAVTRGLRTEGLLPGRLGVQRKAPTLLKQSRSFREGEGKLLVALDAYAFAASEENAVGNMVVTAPTTGAAGVIPSVLRVMTRHMGIEREHCREALLAAALVGFLCKHNASIAGADVGCQGEVGVASAMAAAMLCHALGKPAAVVENAAEVALEHHLGLTCDPVDGYVQIPCIERNGMGAVKAFNAYVIAASEDPGHHMVGLDGAIMAMAQTGHDMCAKYKETSQGGLAVCAVGC
ncbi:MAG: L-serine ammonia-lyase [Desulfovibrionaceae bacterium]